MAVIKSLADFCIPILLGFNRVYDMTVAYEDTVVSPGPGGNTYTY